MGFCLFFSFCFYLREKESWVDREVGRIWEDWEDIEKKNIIKIYCMKKGEKKGVQSFRVGLVSVPFYGRRK